MLKNNVIYVHKKSVASYESICAQTTDSEQDHVPIKLSVLPSRVTTVYCLHQ